MKQFLKKHKIFSYALMAILSIILTLFLFLLAKSIYHYSSCANWHQETIDGRVVYSDPPRECYR